MNLVKRLRRYASENPQAVEDIVLQAGVAASIGSGLSRLALDTQFGHLPTCLTSFDCYYWPTATEWLVYIPVTTVLGLLFAYTWVAHLTPDEGHLDLMVGR